MNKLLTFKQAIADARAQINLRPTVLLGNGFSMDYDRTIFDYGALAEEAELADLSVGKAELFASAQSNNFETVVERLRSAAALHKLYDPGSPLAKRLRRDASIVQRGLADTLAKRHPDSVLDLTEDEVLRSRRFLSNFRAIYSINYDLLLYWVINNTEPPVVVRRDGFERPTRGPGPLIWKRHPSQGDQQIFYLHGALHLFVDENKRLTKLSNLLHGALVDELRRRLDDGGYPLVVTEGTREEKEARIDRSAYLRTAMRRFGEVQHALFIHGMSLSQNDDHILELIETGESSISSLYVAVHGDPDSRAGRRLMDRARRMQSERRDSGGDPLRLKFYDSSTARVWRK